MGLSENDGIALKIAQLAGRQHGHVTRGQLLGLGLGTGAIQHRLATRRLVRVHHGVYAVGYRRVEPVARAAAAVLAAGSGAALSHDSAAALWGMERRWPADPEITAPRCVRRPGIRAHRTTLNPGDVTVQLAIRTTTAARTLRDIRPRLSARRFTRLANEARRRHVLGDDAFAALVRHDRNFTRSGLEDAFQRFVDRYHLPQPEINARLDGREVDVLYRAERVIIELDDYATHGDPAAFAEDRERDTANAATGHLTLRLVRERLTAAEAKRLQAILTARGTRR